MPTEPSADAPPRPPALTADEVIDRLGLEPHPEGGYYRETFRHPPPVSGPGARPLASAIYFLLRRGEPSAWHRLVDCEELWHFYDGAPLELLVLETVATPGAGADREAVSTRLGIDLVAGERPQARVPAGAWQRARTLGDWTLVGCTTTPGFLFSRFELAEPAD